MMVHSKTKPRLLRPVYFIWALPAALLLASYLTYGLPYIIWSYEFRAQTYSDLDRRYYTRCSYIGSGGLITELPTNGKCSWFRFHKSGASS